MIFFEMKFAKDLSERVIRGRFERLDVFPRREGVYQGGGVGRVVF